MTSVATMDLIDYVKALEGRENQARGQRVVAELQAMGIEPLVQQCPWPELRNVIVDFSSGPGRRLVFSAHYDAVKGSPGANDNASGVAVLLGLCRELKGSNAPARVIFFDREEAWLSTPVLRLGLLGSLYYTWWRPRDDIAAVFNLEFCGTGDCLVAWPVKDKEHPAILGSVVRASAAAGLPLATASFPWVFMTSDHMSFRTRGMDRSVTLSLLPQGQTDECRRALRKVGVWGLLRGKRYQLPAPLSCIHTANDSSATVNEVSLRSMLSVVRALVEKGECT